MITLVSTVVGFLSSGVPTLVDYFKDKRDKEHEITLMKMQMEMAERNIKSNLDAIELQNQAVIAQAESAENIAEINAIYKNFNTGITWVDAINGMVRPLIAFALIGLYCAIELMIFNILSTNKEILSIDALEALWGEEDQILFSVVLSFYFGTRAIKKFGKQ